MAISEKAKQALAKLRGFEASEAADVASALESELDAIDAKNYTVIGEKRTETARRQALEDFATAMGKALNVDGDIEAVLSAAQGKAQALTAEHAAALKAKADLESRASTAESKIQTYETDSKRRDLAAKSGADFAVFSDLFKPEDLEKFTVADEGVVSFDGKPLREYVQTDERLKRYESALFTTEKKPNAPTTPPGRPPAEGKADPLKDYLKRTYNTAA